MAEKIEVGDLVRPATHPYAFYRVVRMLDRGDVEIDGGANWPAAYFAEVIKPAKPRARKKIKPSEALAWLRTLSNWTVTADDQRLGHANIWQVLLVGNGVYGGPTLTAAIIALRAALRKAGKL